MLLLVAAPGCRPAAPPSPPASAGQPRVRFETDLGPIEVALDPAAAPLTARHFLALVESGLYDQTVFHPVLRGRCVGGGRLRADGGAVHTPKRVANEWLRGLPHQRGTIALSREVGDPRTQTAARQRQCWDSASAEFFINLVHDRRRELRQPDGAGFTAFGRVVHGMELIDRIAAAPLRRAAEGGPGRPAEPVTIRKALVVAGVQ